MSDINLNLKDKYKSTQRASWIFGSLLLLFVILVFVFAPEELPPYKHRQLGFLCALLAGLFAYFFIGTNAIVIKTTSPLARFVFRGGGGASLFALVLLWWGSPYTLVKVEKKIDVIKKDTDILVKEHERQKEQSLDWLSPNISPVKAYEDIMSSFAGDLRDYELIEVLGSYYICLEPPNRIFHRFPEWTFTFRHKINRNVLQYQLFDARVPRPLAIKVPNTKKADIIYYIVFKEEYDNVELRRALEASTGKRIEGNTFEVAFFNDLNLAYEISGGATQRDRLVDTKDSDRFKVIGRYQALGRDYTSPPNEWLKIESFTGAYNLNVSTSQIESVSSLDALSPIDPKKWTVDVDRAIEIAITNGAIGLRPGQSNYPGILRLYYIKGDNLDGIYWYLPYRLDLQLFVVDAENGKLLIFKGPLNGFVAK